MRIVNRYMKFLFSAGRSDELKRRFENLQIDESATAKESSLSLPLSASLSRLTLNLLESTDDGLPEKDLSLIMMAMRKLREGIVASKRVDDFSMQAYFFCIRLSILVKHMESYHPALLYLLNKMHPKRPLSNIDLQEFAGYLVLDLACRQGDLAQAHVIRRRFHVKDSKTIATLSALAHDNYHLFWRLQKSVDGHKVKMMEFAEPNVRKHALKCLGRTYFQLDKDYVERATNSTWTRLLVENQVGWELQDTTIIIRKPKTR